MQKVRTKDALIFPILLSIFRKILEAEKIRVKKRQIHYQEMTLRNNYYSNMKKTPEED